jgi:hypothetical protein
MWLEMVRVISQTVDDDYAPRAYPVHPEVVQSEEKAPEPVAAEGEVLVPPIPAAGETGDTHKIKSTLPPAPWGPLNVEKPSRRRRRRSRSSRRSENDGGGRKWKLSLLVCLIVSGVGAWLIMGNTSSSRDLIPEEFADVRPPDVMAPKTVLAELHEQERKIAAEKPPEMRPVDIKSLTLAKAEDNWEMAEGALSADPLVAGKVAAAVDGGAVAPGAKVVAVDDGSSPAPSAEFLSYAATLEITSVVWGKRVRATINGATYVDDGVLEPELGVRLMGKDPDERALIFEDRAGARVKVGY